jgi:hypothetical protein
MYVRANVCMYAGIMFGCMYVYTYVYICVYIIFLGSKARPARKADKLTVISEPTVKVMWDP